MVTLTSFGYHYGQPTGLVVDARSLHNPHRQFKGLSGLDKSVQDSVLSQAGAAAKVRLILRWAEKYGSVSCGCGWGRHRSVAIVEEAARLLKAQGIEVNIIHRDLSLNSTR